MNRKQQQPTAAHSCQSACSLPSSISSPSSATSPSSTPSIVSSFLPSSSRAPLQYGSEFDSFYGGDLAISPTSPKQPSPYPRPSGGGGGRGGAPPCRAFDLSRSLCEGFGIAKDPLLVDVFGFDSITPTTVSTTTSTTTNTNGARRPLMRNQSLEEDAAGLQRLDTNECRQRETRMTEGYGGRQPDPEATSGQAISAIQMWSTNWGSSSTPYSNSIACASDRYFRRRHHLHHHHHHHHRNHHYHQVQQPPHPMTAALVADGGVRECASCGASLSKTVLRRRNSFGHYICCSCESQLRINESIRATATTTKKATQTKKSSRRSGLLCANCNSSASTLWRRNNEGETVCNACGLYYKLHGINRPITMRKDGIQTRKRRPKGSKLLLNGGQSCSSSPDQELTTKTTRLQHGSSVTSDKCNNPRMSSSSKSCSPRRDDIGASKREPLSPIHASPTKDPRVPTTFGHLSDSNYNSYGSMLHHPCAAAPGCPPPVVSQPEHDLRRSHLFAFYDGQDLAKTPTTTLTNLEVPPKCHQSVPYAHPYNSRNALHQEHEKQLNYGSGAPLQHAAGPLYGVTSVPTAFPAQGGEPHRSFNSYYNFSNYNCYNFSNFNSCSAAVYQM